MSRIKPLAVLTLCIAILAGCNAKHQIASDPVDYNQSAAIARDNMLVLNIARASNRMPMQFASITSINGSVQSRLSSTTNLPLTDRFTSSNFNNSITGYYQQSPSYTLGILDTQKFMKGILDPVKPETMFYYQTQGWNPKLLACLYIEKIHIQVKSDGGDWEHVDFVENNPTNKKDFEQFKEIIEGVESEQFKITRTETPRRVLSPLEIPAGDAMGYADLILKAMELGATASKAGKATVNGQEVDVYHFFKGKNIEFGFDYSPTADPKKSPAIDKPDSSDDHIKALLQEGFEMTRQRGSTSKKYKLIYTPRSVEGMIYYLGELVRADKSIDIVNSEGKPRSLFKMQCGAHPVREQMSIRYMDETYSVDTEGTKSTQCLSLITQLMALHKESSELPSTPLIRTISN